MNTALTSNVYSINLDPPIRVQYGDVIGVFQPEKKKSSMEMYLYKTVINYDYYFIDKLDDAKSTVYSSEVKVKEDEFPLITAVIGECNICTCRFNCKYLCYSVCL